VGVERHPRFVVKHWKWTESPRLAREMPGLVKTHGGVVAKRRGEGAVRAPTKRASTRISRKQGEGICGLINVPTLRANFGQQDARRKEKPALRHAEAKQAEIAAAIDDGSCEGRPWERVAASPSVDVVVRVTGGKVDRVSLRDNADEGLRLLIGGEHAGGAADAVRRWVEGYARGQPPADPLPLALPSPGGGFTAAVLRAMGEVPFGATVSYGELARRAGSPGAARAAGQACGSNPLALVLPCHRILAAGNKLGGFSCGLSVKRKLLAHEGLL